MSIVDGMVNDSLADFIIGDARIESNFGRLESAGTENNSFGFVCS